MITVSVCELGASITELFYINKQGEKFNILRGDANAAIKSSQKFNPLECAMFPMLPFVNRVSGNCFKLYGKKINLPTHHLDDSFFLHGDGWINHWSIKVVDNTIKCYLESDIDDVCHYSACQNIALHDNLMIVSLSLKNLGPKEFPFGIGLHPYFKCEHDSLLEFSPNGVWLEQENHLPGEYLEVIPDSLLFNNRKVPDFWVNNCYSFTEKVIADITHSDGVKVSIYSDAKYMMVYRPSGQYGFICLEPQTQMLDAHNNVGYTSLKMLENNEEMSLTLSIEISHI